MELGAVVTDPSQTVVSDPGSSVSQRVQAVNSSPVSLACWSAASADVEEDWPDEWCNDWESDWMDDWQDDWYWHNSEGSRANGTMMKVPIWCVDSYARVQI